LKLKKAKGKIRKERVTIGSKSLLFPVLIILLLTLIVSYFFLDYYFSIIEKRDIYAKVILSDHYGFDINGTALIFGMIAPGGSASKELIITNDYEREVNVKFLVEGGIGEFMRISENNFVLGKNEVKKIGFVVLFPSSAEYGVYDGNVVVLIRKA